MDRRHGDDRNREFHRTYPSLLGEGTIRAARVGRDGTLLDGAPAPAGGRALTFTDPSKFGRDYPRVGRLGSTTFVVWEHLDISSFERRITGTRLDAQGNPLDTSSTDDGLWIAMPGFAHTPAIAFGGDRSLVVSVQIGGNDWTLGDTLLFPF